MRSLFVSGRSLVILGLLVFCGLGFSQVKLGEAIPEPEHYFRVKMPSSGFISTLRDLEIYPDRELIAGDGVTVLCEDNIVAATDIEPFEQSSEVGVDGVLRMWGNYLWKHGNRKTISFPMDNGQIALWEDWRMGMRPKKSGGKYIFTQVTTPDGGRANYDKFLAFVAEQMGAIALQRESEIVVDDSIHVGDLIVSLRENKQSWLGLVLDMCKGPKGEKLFLVGTSGAPATTFYVMRPYSPVQGLNEWFTLEGAKWAIGDGARVYLRRVRLEL
ncbi:hypothetical protein KKC97_04075 [bacterium]|nr:hypothetical protein [bacterium]MBU1636823.1 hypothetical protein [bacterium]